MSVALTFRKGHAVFIGIYKITSPSGKVYIGQSWDIVQRWRCYKSSYPLRSQVKLANSLKKYGAKNHTFDILMWFSTTCDQETLDRLERQFMAEHRSAGIELLNIRDGGRGGRQSPETSAKMVATRRANGSYVVSDELRKKWSEQRKGHPGVKHTEETKRKLSGLALLRKPPSEVTRERLGRAWRGRQHTEESKAKIGAANKGNKRPDLAAYNLARAARKRDEQ